MYEQIFNKKIDGNYTYIVGYNHNMLFSNTSCTGQSRKE